MRLTDAGRDDPPVQRHTDLNLALGLALLAMVLSLPGLISNPPLNYDEGYILQVPLNLLTRGFYGTQDAEWRWVFDPHVTTGPPVTLAQAVSFAVLGTGVAQARLVTVLYAGLAAAAAYGVARRVARPAVAVVAALLVTLTLYPHNRIALGEVPALALYLTGAWLWLIGVERARPGRWLVLAGLAWGCAALAKLAMAPIVLCSLAGAWLALALRGQRPRLWTAVLPALVLLAPLVGWFAVQAALIGPGEALARWATLGDYQQQNASPTARTLVNLLRLNGPLPDSVLAWGAPLVLALGVGWLAAPRIRPGYALAGAFMLAAGGFYTLSTGWPRYGFWMEAGVALLTGLLVPTVASLATQGLRLRAVTSMAAAVVLLPAAVWLSGRVAPIHPDEPAEVANFLRRQASIAPLGTTEWELDFLLNRALKHPPTMVATLTQQQVDAAFDWTWPGMDWVAVGVVGMSLGADVKLADNPQFVERLQTPHYRLFQRYSGPAPGWTWSTTGATATLPLHEATAGQTFVAASDTLTEVRVLLAGGARTTNGPVTLRLFADPPAGPPLAESTLEGATVTQNRWYGFPIDDVAVEKGRRYTFELSSPTGTPTAANAWYQDGADYYPEGGRLQNRQPVAGDLYFGVLGFDRAPNR